ncbi:hypothetical protein OS493_009020 [Desmophyllum pertusum]|uniref:Uncharacterized protein n=1 Tax=Desmophyllum pertusum TaxID=174260 RepID=A0A9W9ZF28_9CNID|nr:hypothetical protein OS493_009020 [Desmophyllum pertusum]
MKVSLSTSLSIKEGAEQGTDSGYSALYPQNTPRAEDIIRWCNDETEQPFVGSFKGYSFLAQKSTQMTGVHIGT